jgi:L-serine dehydratase
MSQIQDTNERRAGAHSDETRQAGVDRRTFLMRSAVASVAAAVSGARLTAEEQAAALLAQAYHGSPQMVENAAGSALEAHLGLTCDPVAGFVQIPCIERCAFGAAKGWTAFAIASNESAATHRVDLDSTIRTMAETGRDMSRKYKETSEGGLAVNVTLC